MDGPGTQCEPVLHSGLSNSTESIDSMKALTAAIEAANAQIHGPASQHVSNSTITISTTPPSPLPMPMPVPVPIPIPALDNIRRDVLRKSRCLSIGIQVSTLLRCSCWLLEQDLVVLSTIMFLSGVCTQNIYSYKFSVSRAGLFISVYKPTQGELEICLLLPEVDDSSDDCGGGRFTV